MATNYAPGEVKIIVDGVPLSGKNKVSIEPLYDQNTESQDSDGNFIYTTNPAYKHVTVTLTLHQASSDNAVLSALYELNPSAPIIIYDLSGNTTFEAAEMVFKRRATTEMGLEVGERTWTFIGEYQLWIDGGN